MHKIRRLKTNISGEARFDFFEKEKIVRAKKYPWRGLVKCAKALWRGGEKVFRDLSGSKNLLPRARDGEKMPGRSRA